MSTAALRKGYVFHVYLPSLQRIACGANDERVAAVIAADWANRLEPPQICSACARVVGESTAGCP